MIISKSLFHFVLHLLIFIIALIITVSDFGLFAEYELYRNLFFLILTGSILAVITETYKPKLYQKKVKYIIAPYIKFALLFWLTNFLFAILFISNQIIEQKIIALITLYSLAFLLIYFLLFILIKKSSVEVHQINVESTKKYKQKELNVDPNYKIGKIDNDLLSKLSLISPTVLSSIWHGQDQKSIAKVIIIDNEKTGRNSGGNFEICIFDKRLNDLADINSLFRNIYNNLKDGGYSVFVFEDLENFENRYVHSRYKSISLLKGIYYYFYYRALPKILFINQVYNLFSDGKRKVISNAEVLGRLVYCGFEKIEEKVDNKLNYLLVRKTLEPSRNPNPSFYPIIALDRVSLFGEIIKIHKIRSMYPYSEFLQKKIFESNGITLNGKFVNDFRVTKPGKYIRKYWLDELPQIYDWLRGELKLVGIRALSQHFYSLYPKEFQELFVKVKPGIISPIFDEDTSGFDDIVRIEKSYLESYLKKPISTDIKYFFSTMRQILSGLRSN